MLDKAGERGCQVSAQHVDSGHLRSDTGLDRLARVCSWGLAYGEAAHSRVAIPAVCSFAALVRVVDTVLTWCVLVCLSGGLRLPPIYSENEDSGQDDHEQDEGEEAPEQYASVSCAHHITDFPALLGHSRMMGEATRQVHM
jgi:hypothetical protein